MTGCAGLDTQTIDTAPTENQTELSSEELKLHLSSAWYPHLILVDDKFYLSTEFNDSISVREYDRNFSLLQTFELTHNEGTDHRLVYGDGYFYLVSSFYIRKYDPDFNELKRVPLLDGFPEYSKPDIDERQDLDDPLAHYAEHTLFVGKGYSEVAKVINKNGKKPNQAENFYICEYDEELNLTRGVNLPKVGFMAMNLIVQPDRKYLVNSDKRWEDTSLQALEYDQDWNLLSTKIISAVSNANEEFATGLAYDSTHFYVSYQQITGDIGQPEPGRDSMNSAVMLKVYDHSWNEIAKVDVSQTATSEETGHSGRPSIAVTSDGIYVAYDRTTNTGPDTFVKYYQISK